MAKRRSLEDTLRDLNGLREELRADPASARVAAELGRALGALAALEVYLEGPAMRRRVRAAVAGRNDLKLPPAIAQKLAADDGDAGTTSPR